MVVKEFAEGGTVFSYGDTGSTFCIVLKGRVGIYIPTAAYMRNEDTGSEEDTTFMKVFE
jgi:CRP-like cAMP-binding protein